jgi:hypothetical protein
MRLKFLTFLFFPGILLLLSFPAKSQFFYRIECDISIKKKIQAGEGVLILGRVFYDKNIGKMVYDIRFPEKEIWVIKDTTLTIQKGETIDQIRSIDAYNESTIFHKILEGKLNNYGLEGTIYSIKNVTKDGEMVITTWAPASSRLNLGQIFTSTVNGELHGVVFQNMEGEVIARQLFRNYTLVRGLRIPTEIVQVFYKPEGEEYQVFSLSNIRINNPENESKYNYTISAH